MSAAQKLPSLILQTQSQSPSEVINHFLCSGNTHICQTDGYEFAKELRAAQACEREPMRFFTEPLEMVLENHEVLFESNFNSAKEKSGIISGINKAIDKLNLTESFSNDIQLVADEMFTNAIYNAPVTDLKTHVNPGVARDTRAVSMHQGKLGHLFLAQDQSRLLIGCKDPYGTLNVTDYLQKILATYEVGADFSMNFGKGGAGIGSYIIFNSGCSLYIGVCPGRATIVCCVFPGKMSGKGRAALPKHLHCIQY